MCDDVIHLTPKGVFIFGLQVLQVSFCRAYNNNNKNNNNNNNNNNNTNNNNNSNNDNNNNNNNNNTNNNNNVSLLHSVQFSGKKNLH